MKKLLLATSILMTTGATSFAADLTSIAPTFAVNHWAGFYVGAQFGGTQASVQANVPILLANGTVRDNAPIGGIHVGHNWQVNSLVVGIEVDGNLSAVDRTISQLGGVALGGTVRASSRYEAGLVGKIGLSFNQALIYVLGGASVANYASVSNVAGTSRSIDENRFGWTLGAGIAYKFSSNWSGRIEYRYADYGSTVQAFIPGVNVTRHVKTQRIMVGLSYQFGGPAAPVVAKY